MHTKRLTTQAALPKCSAKFSLILQKRILRCALTQKQVHAKESSSLQNVQRNWAMTQFTTRYTKCARMKHATEQDSKDCLRVTSNSIRIRRMKRVNRVPSVKIIREYTAYY